MLTEVSEMSQYNYKEIIRTYPKIYEQIYYPIRYSNNIFEKYIELSKNKELLTKYNKWKSGINYNYITNRKINIGGKNHKNLQNIFMIKYNDNKSVLFDELKCIDFEKYLEETNNIYKEIDDKNEEIYSKNKEIQNIINEINKLEKLDEIYFI
jgi:hypothetical protein